MAPRPALDRLKARPDPGAWADDELISLSEAVALFMPHGPLTAASLRTAYRRGELAGREVCGRLFTTRRDVEAMTKPRLLAPVVDRGDEVTFPALPTVASTPSRELARRIAVARRRRGLRAED